MFTAQFDNTNFAYCSMQYIYILRLILTINGREFLTQHSVTFFFFIFMITQCVLSEVRTEFLSIIESRFSFHLPCHGSGTESTVCQKKKGGGDSVQSQANPCGICGGRSGIGKGFSSEYVCFVCQYFPPMFHACLYLCYSSQRANKRSMGNFQKQWPFVNQGTLDTPLLSVFSLFEVLK